MNAARPVKLTIRGRELPLPVFFPSISSVKTALPLHDYLQILSSLSGLNRQFLVSAYDLSSAENPMHVKNILASVRREGLITVMDSGNYESYWKNAQTDWRQADFHKVLSAFPCDMAFSFDEQNPPSDSNDHVTLVVERYRKDQAIAGSCQIIPIIHAPAGELPDLCMTVASETSVTMLAVPERKLGDGILARAQTVKTIRSALDKLGRYVALHLLGTGNPISITLYSVMGADSMDGLEWCQTAVDHETGLLYHFSHADFFSAQTEWNNRDLSFQVRTLAHNLEFYSDWMRRLRDAICQKQLHDFCRLNLPKRVFQHCADFAGWKKL